MQIDDKFMFVPNGFVRMLVRVTLFNLAGMFMIMVGVMLMIMSVCDFFMGVFQNQRIGIWVNFPSNRERHERYAAHKDECRFQPNTTTKVACQWIGEKPAKV